MRATTWRQAIVGTLVFGLVAFGGAGSAMSLTEGPTDGADGALSQQVGEEPTEEAGEDPAEGVREEWAEEASEEPTGEAGEESTEETTEEPTGEAGEESTEEASEEPTGEAGDGATDAGSAEPSVGTAGEETDDAQILLTPDPTNTISIDKANTADGEPASDGGTVEPGDTYTYNFAASCSSIEVDCVNLTVVDIFPADVIVDESTIPADVDGFREVTYDAGTRTLTVVYVEPLTNPAGETGKLAGSSDNFTVTVTLPEDTGLETGAEIQNEATVSADNVEESATDPSPVVVNIPRTLDVETSKSFSDSSLIGGDPDATTTINLEAANLSSSSAEVSELTIEDSTPATWDYLNLDSVTVTQYPAGADQAQLFVCPTASAPCAEDDYVAGGTATPPGPSTLDLPASVEADEVVGIRVAFTAPDGSAIAPVTDGGTAAVEVETDLRETVRSTGEPIAEIPESTTIDNSATSEVVDAGADPTSATDDATAQLQIVPPTLILTPAKSFIPDSNGNFATDNGEHAVIGESSGASVLIDAENSSAFPIAEIVITEPGVPPPPTEFDKFDASSIRLQYPSGAANAQVVITYDDGSTTTEDYPAPGPGTLELDDSARVTSITVTYTGPDEDGDGNPDPTIEPGANAGLDVHGQLNDSVDASDLQDGVVDCADFEGSGGGVPGTTGTYVGTECATLPIEDRNPDTGGEKTASQDEIPPDQPVVFRLSTANTGNLPLYDVVVADPPLNEEGVPPTTATYTNLRFLDAAIVNDEVGADITLEVYVLSEGWMSYPGPSDNQLRLVTGVRATLPVLAPTESFDLLIEMQLRYFADPTDEVENCYSVVADDSSGATVVDNEHCAPPLPPAEAEQAATLNKLITPSSVPERIPGMDPADSQASVQLRVQNTGTLTAQYLQVTDEDTDFWDAVDFTAFGEITAPAVGQQQRADLIQVDALVDGDWVDGVPGAIGSAALPAGVGTEDVRGLRFTFSSSLDLNDGYVITPCNADPAGGCAGVVEFDVQPRLALLSSGQPLPEVLEDTATGAFSTQLAPEGTEIPPVSDDLSFVPGDPQIDVDKTPDATTVQPGQISTFSLTTTNNGTANLPDVTVSDPLPAGLVFDDTFADSETGEPFTVRWSNLPEGYPEPPAAVFEATPDPDDPSRVGMLRWTFPDFEMPPNATVSIAYRYTLEPGVVAGQVITNTMGASSPVEDLSCTEPDVPVTDGDFGSGTYCTDPAQVTVAAGASFAARKWVAGNADLGWYNESTGELVPVGGGDCLSIEANGRVYTTNPCIALVNPGEQLHYLLRVQNAGTEDALQMVVIDTFPAPGDSGVLGADRGTEWATAPTLAGPATYSGPATGEIGYTSGEACIDDLYLDQEPCPDQAWAETAGPSSTALRLKAIFDPDALPPGGIVDVSFAMEAPADVPRVSDPTVAYNSIAHAEITEPAPGQERILAPLEPLKVGVATMYGNLEVVKEIGDNPADLVLEDVQFEFAYECALSTGAASVSGEVTATASTPGLVTGIPAGATCDVWETGTNGGIPSAPESDPVRVVIEPNLNPEDPVLSSVTVTNHFPLGTVDVLKTVSGDALDEFTVGPYPATVTCTFEGETLEGFPVTVELAPGEVHSAEAPVGSECLVEEQDVPEAVTVTYDPANSEGTAGLVVVPSEEGGTVTVEVTNEFAVGSLVVTKLVTGPGSPEFSTGPFIFEVTCDYLDTSGVYTTTVEVQGASDGSPVTSDPVTGLPIGASCTVTEVEGGGTDLVPDPVTVVIEADEPAEAVVVSLTNAFSAGEVAVAKTVTGTAAGSDYVAGLEYTFVVQCALETDDALLTVLDEEVTVLGDGVPVPVTAEDGSAMLVPVGARCWGTETANGGATEVSVDHDSYENGVAVVADPQAEEAQSLLITATNTFDSAPLTLTKEVVGDYDPDATYDFSIACTTIDADGSEIDVPPITGASTVTLGAGDSATLDVLVGATCIVTELDVPSGAAVGFLEAGDAPDEDPTDGVLTIDAGGAAVVVTNTFPGENVPSEPMPTYPVPDGASGDLPSTGWNGLIPLAALALTFIGAGALVRSRKRVHG